MSRKPHLNFVNSKNEANEMGQILTGSAWINCMNKTDPSAEEKINAAQPTLENLLSP